MLLEDAGRSQFELRSFETQTEVDIQTEFGSDSNDSSIAKTPKFEPLTLQAMAAPAVDATLTARIDDQFFLYLNGDLIMSAGSWLTIQEADIQLQAGDVIAIRAIDWSGPGGVFVDLRLDDGTQIGSSSDWLVSETVTGDWTAQGFDDSAWVNATEYGGVGAAPWGPTGSGLQLPTDSTAQWIWTNDNVDDNQVYLRFTIPNDMGGPQNTSPQVDTPIADQITDEDQPFIFIVPASTFSDADGDTLDYSATLADGSVLPAWITFDAETLTFSGTPGQSDIGSIDIRVTANDGNGGTTGDTFQLSINNINDAPVVSAPVPDQAATTDLPFSFFLAPNTFFDEDGDILVLEATLADGSNLPAWLTFDAATGSFSGTPTDSDIAALTIRVTADDGNGEITFDDFNLTVSLPQIDLSFEESSEAVVVDLATNTQALAAKVLVMGDSISAGFFSSHAYRLSLWEGLVEESGLWFDFVGGNTDVAGELIDAEHQGEGGFTIDNYVPFVGGLLNLFSPDLTIVMLGTNDVLLDVTSEDDVPAELLNFLREIDSAQPGTQILLSEIPALNPEDYLTFLPALNPNGDIDVEAINAALPGIVALAQSEGMNVSLVSQADFTIDDLQFGDGIHPSLLGDMVLAEAFYQAVLSAVSIDGGTFNTSVSTIASTIENVTGSDAGDRISGDDAVNTIDGGAGSDWLEGRGSADILTGGAGRDIFAFANPSDGGDTITDFTSGEDKISVRVDAFASLFAANPITLITDGTATTGDAVFLYNTSTGALSFDADGTGASAEVIIAFLQGSPTLTASDISTYGRGVPMIAGDLSITLDEGGSNTLTANDLSGLDADDDGDSLIFTVAYVSDGDILVDGVSATTFTLADIENARVSYVHDGSENPVAGFEVFLSDDSGLSASAPAVVTANINNINDDPEVAAPLPDQSAFTGSSYVFALPADTFFDADGDSLDISASLSDGSDLPDWLSFDPETGIFSGTPPLGQSGAISIRVAADDGNGGSTYEDFVLNLSEPPTGPVDATLTARIDDQYFLYLNGELILSAGSWLTIQEADLELEAGDVIAVRAFDWGGPGGVFIDLRLDDGTQIGSSSDWLISETVSGDWTSQNFDDSAWISATEYGGVGTPPWGPTGSGLQLPADSTAQWIWTDDNVNDNQVYIRFTVPDGLGAPNNAPSVLQPLADQTADEDSEFSFIVPADTFNDIDGDTLELSATLANGDSIPAWLNFDPVSGTFSGTPVQDDVGTLSIRVTADDGRGGTAIDVFNVSVANVNDAPTIDNFVDQQTAIRDEAFSFVVPANTFIDEDGDTLTLSATLSGGSALPAWLAFDDTTNIFSGTPSEGDLGTLSIALVASDGNGGEVELTFNLFVDAINTPPVVDSPISDITIDEDSLFNFVLPVGVFFDSDGDPLELSATLSDGSALPNWLNFDAVTNTFSGTPLQDDVGTIDINLTADDGRGGVATDTFSITVENLNDNPEITAPIVDQSGFVDTPFSFILPTGTFSDEDGDDLVLTGTLLDGSALPSWLNFNAVTGTFSGTPQAGDTGEISVRVTADDANGGTVFDDFNLLVSELPTGPVDATLTARIDDQFFLYINGDLVMSAGSWLTIQEADIQLEAGDVIAIWALDWGGPGGVFVDLRLDDGTQIGTSSDWLVSEPVAGDWTSQDFDDSAWVGATEYGAVGTAPWGPTGSGLQLPTDSTAQWIWTDDNINVDQVYIRYTVPDGIGSGSGSSNSAPVVDIPLADQSIGESDPFSFTVPSDTFSDADEDTLTLTATLANGDALPSWLSFDPSTGAFTGTPDSGDVGLLVIRVTADDGNGGTVSDEFQLDVTGPRGSNLSYLGTTQAVVVDLAAGTSTPAAEVLLLGDSITEGWTIPGGYRLPLFEGLVEDNDLWVDFTGGRTTLSTPDLMDLDHQGQSGITAAQVLANINNITAANDFSHVVMLLGTNDVLAQDSPANIIDNLLDILRALETANSDVTVVLGTIPAIGNNTTLQALADQVNALLPNLIITAQSEGIDVSLVDLGSLNPATDYVDNLHPNADGAAELAELWLDALLTATNQNGGTLDGSITDISGTINVVGSEAGDRLAGDNAANIIQGAGGNDWLEGRGGNDFLEGNDGDDVLGGGSGTNTLIGGNGNDTYVVHASDVGTSTILQFEASETTQLVGFGFANESEAASYFNQSGGDIVFSFGGTTITYEGFTSLASVLSGIELIDAPMMSSLPSLPIQSDDADPIESLLEDAEIPQLVDPSEYAHMMAPIRVLPDDLGEVF